METMGTLRRTNYCGEVSLANAGQEMTVCGSIARARDKGGIIFADLRDTTGILQLVFDEDTPKDVFAKAESLKSEYVVICRGKLRERAAKTDKIATGDVELYVSELRILSEAQTTPFELRDEINVNDDLRLRYRYLDLRRPSMHEPIVLRSKIMQIIRNYFCENHFCEIETPTLIKSTPEGARDYLVPSRVQPGHFYALPQSPQLYKQILMLSGFDRYFQIARCYRDEDLRADRQPEFTQVDEEMSFVSEDDIMTINEGLIKRLWKEMLNIDVQTPFVRMPWDEAMGRFGSDKPDTRFGLEIQDVTEVFKGTEFKPFAAVLEAARACRWPAFEEDRGTGLLRHVLVRRGKTSGQVLVVLVTAQENLPGSRNFVKALREKAPWVTSVVQNCNPRRTSAVLGSDVRTLYGPGKITDTLCGLQFAISPRSFYQVNPEQTEVLYAKAIEFAALTGKETVIDAYCGIGTIGLCAAGRAKQVIGVERNPDAVRNACANAAANKINNARFICADATDWMRAAAQPNSGLPHPDVVFLDPPREGSTPACIDAVAAMKPKRVVYVSCNPETLARDLTHLTRRGWKALKIQPVDMFPHTEHVETVVLLSQQKPDDTIEIDLDLDELDATAAETKATYEEIKAYIWDTHHLKVSSLYISQIKRKCGLEVGQNYNLSKSENPKVPKCPPEKEAAIMDALKHFQMI